ncbi:MAG: NfeD family protein [Bacteriovoracaceae bacterium]
MIRHSIVLLIGLFVCALLGHAQTNYDVTEARILTVKSAITPATFDYLENELGKASLHRLTIIRMNTPGGLVSTTKDIIALFAKGNHPVVVWVAPEGASAASAGSIIASGAHFIFMAPGTNMGAATPVGLGEDIKESDGRKKALNDLTAMVRSLSAVRGRPAGPFEEMIREAKSFTDKEALQAKIIDGIVSDEKTLLHDLNGKTWKTDKAEYRLAIPESVTVKEIEPSMGQSILEVLTNPSTAYFLFLLGAALIYFELQAPGGYIAGSIGATLLVLAAIAFQVLPLDWGAFALILVGVVCLMLEMYITSYGLLGIAGIVAFALGSLFLFHGESGYISVQYPVLFSTFLGILVPLVFLSWYVLKDARKKKDPLHFFVPLASPGVVMKKNGPYYQVKVRGEIWNAHGDEELSPGDEISVVDADNKQLTLKVRKKTT